MSPRSIAGITVIAALLAVAPAAPAANPGKPQLRQAANAFDSVFGETLATFNRLVSAADGTVRVCRQAVTIHDDRARRALWRLVNRNTRSSDRLWTNWLEGLKKRLGNRAAHIESLSSKIGLSVEAEADVAVGHAKLERSIELLANAEFNGESANERMRSHNCHGATRAINLAVSNAQQAQDKEQLGLHFIFKGLKRH